MWLAFRLGLGLGKQLAYLKEVFYVLEFFWLADP